MAEALRIFTEPWDVKRRLRELGLTVEILINAVERSFASWAACTPNDPLNFPAIAGWAAAIRSLGDDLAPKGWMRVEDVGQPLIVNANQTIALTVASCDENTGRVDEFQPRTKASKGPRTLEKVQNNAYLFPEMEEDRDARIQAAISRSTNTWMLLIHRDRLAGEVRCELSRPIALDPERHIDTWSERIILKPVDFERTYRALPDDGRGGTDAGEIQIEIKRRG